MILSLTELLIWRLRGKSNDPEYPRSRWLVAHLARLASLIEKDPHCPTTVGSEGLFRFVRHDTPDFEQMAQIDKYGLGLGQQGETRTFLRPKE